jgi:hypothetical protein
MTTYQLTDGDCVIKDGITIFPTLPNKFNGEFHHYALEYFDWIKAGGVPDPYIPPPEPIPTVLTMRQARLALLNANLLTTVNAAVAASSDQVKIEWEFSNEVQRANPLIAMLSAGLGLTEPVLDQLFLAGSKL